MRLFITSMKTSEARTEPWGVAESKGRGDGVVEGMRMAAVRQVKKDPSMRRRSPLSPESWRD